MSKDVRKSMVVLTVDDHPLIRSALREVLRELAARVELLEASNPQEGLALLAGRADLDLAFLDLTFAGHDGLDFVGRYRAAAPAVPLVVYTMHDDAAILRRALNAGASGIVPKTHSPQLLRKAVELVMDGGVYLPAELVRVLAAGEPPETTHAAPMSPQQWRIVELLAQGLPNKEIGRKLGIASSTVKNQLTAVFGRLGVSNRTQAAMAASALLEERRLTRSKSPQQSGH